MDYRRFGNTIAARIDKGEEILEQVKAIALKEEIKLASIQALGAVNQFTVGVFKTDEKKYMANDFAGSFEIVSLTGTINTMDGEFYCHLHMSAGDDKGHVFGIVDRMEPVGHTDLQSPQRIHSGLLGVFHTLMSILHTFWQAPHWIQVFSSIRNR